MSEKNLADRLRSEIEGIAGGPSKVAGFLKVARNTVYNWMDKGNIPANKLEALGELGVDIGYVLTGLRTDVFETRLKQVQDATMMVQEVAPEYGVDLMELKELRDLVFRKRLTRHDLIQIFEIIKQLSGPTKTPDIDLELIEAGLELAFKYLAVGEAEDLDTDLKIEFIMHTLQRVIAMDRQPPTTAESVARDKTGAEVIQFLDELKKRKAL